ncbi:hypothetical protein AA23498_2911 [Acetobacter nitrogenifigens DSM 23921 = NBRC 105050]|uniref:Chalcone isomerase domain-containing protein n=2 Tax=Acetobacter nitrogenifigens TaxID=285268 RepID=A0A511XAA2_9PROT|nr:hypothetical protein AA23498_2911 [Acetobacter nitrogenifigens DSM 23921 = NBRC 105050]GEN59884.1 hypothetical protein ANI02nite_17680 [Acetobacter nitrogenifigens DSM 23921 = NBRC 105050]
MFMLRAMLAGVCLAGAIMASTPARADVKAGGVTFPDTFNVYGKTLHLNGVGVRVFYHLVDGYATALYLPEVARTTEAIESAPNPKVIYSVFLHGASAERMRSEYDTIHTAFCAKETCHPEQEESYKKFLGYLTAADSHATQTIVIDDTGVLLLRNNVRIGNVNDPLFGQALIKSLVGPASPTESYRNAIIGGG